MNESPLCAAIRLERMEIVNRLIQHPDIQINQKGLSGKTPLQLALEDLGFGETALIKSLIAYPKISLDKKCWLESIADPFFTVEEMIKAFSTDESLDLEVPFIDKEGRNALHHAVLFDDPELVKNLLSCEKVDIRLKDRNGNTPLHLAILHNRVDNVNSLLNTGVIDDNLWGIDVNFFSSVIFNPLIMEKKHENQDILKLLKDENGNTPLHLAAMSEDVEALNALLKYEKFQDLINQPNNSGNAPLHLAIIHNRVDNVNSLLKTVV